MANLKISDMDPGAALGGTELFESVQTAATVSLLASQIKTYVLTSPTITGAVGSATSVITGGTQTGASSPMISGAQTWNNGATTFVGLLFNVTATASAAASLLIDLQVGAVSQFKISKAGLITGINATFSGIVGSSAITVTGVTQTTSQPILNLAQTWNDGAVAFTAIKSNITNTASAAASLLLDLQVGGTTTFNVAKTGSVGLTAAATLTWLGRSILSSGSDGSLTLTNNAASVTTTVTAGANNALLTNGPVKASGGYTVATLPAVVAGLRAYVTDSNAALTAGIGAVVAAGGANIVPVFCDGTNWRIG